jgi:basic membrane protein A
MIVLFRRSLVITIIISILLSSCTLTKKTTALSLAVILPGSVQDQDYNALAFEAIKELQTNNGMDVRYIENISVSNCTKNAIGFIDNGANVIWLHGGQFLNPGMALARSNPRTVFILEIDAKPDKLLPNVWFIDRNFPKSFYILGRISASATQTGIIGYLSGLNLPFTFGEVHAIQQAIKDSGANVKLHPIWVGDMNDPQLAENGTRTLIDLGADIIISSINLGVAGVVKSIIEADRTVLFTSKYTDKSDLAPELYITSALYDFNIPISNILNNIQNGERGGYFLMDLNSGIAIQSPLQNVPSELDETLTQVQNDILNGKISIVQDFSPID